MLSRMTRRSRIVAGISIMFAMAAVAGLEWGAWSVAADDDLKPDQSLSAFMRKKLDASSQVLEGLTTEDSELIKKGAKTLSEISKAEKWQILSDPEYREYSIDFRINTRKLAEAAESGNFDNATLQWIDTMKDCIECHQHVRRERKQQKK